ncbi:hypothetical protein HME9302_01264 [Alteripontixanthobacter maritimus]|uniref:Inner membrane protein YghQ n=1 Tax=Alteripontixanthobacter maritimus TaxID=2161824 RepID=A0A369Q936_9SPHN|nr:lipopolysaccharide biosynthesis protein [Alteripontixanthobacter maritimus]RDC60065.1 hypothetical protein HME9302_01264 [Alteripontixanthobacter maritimus]
MAEQIDTHHAHDGWQRILKNVGWLLGGKGFGGVCSLIYLAILVRSLGVKDFGHFSLIFGTGQALVALSGFQTWQGIVRYGTDHIAKGAWDKFGRLAMLGGAIDVLGALSGCALAALLIYGFGPMLDLNPRYIDTTFWFICALVLARVSAPVGVIRVYDRYDLTVAAGALNPAGRLIAATLIWLTGPSVERFLFAWAAIEMVVAVLYWTIAWRLRPGVLSFARLRHWRRTLNENEGLFGFLGILYFNSSAMAALQQGPLLAVGYFLGTSAAGIYRVADQLAKGLSKLATLVTQALYPEVTRQRSAAPANQFRKLVRRINILVIGTGLVVVLLAIVAGEAVLSLIGGAPFAAGALVLVPLSIGAAFELASVSYEPVLHSSGHAAYPLFARLIAIAVMAGCILALLGAGTLGIGWAVAIGLGAAYFVMSVMVWRVLRQMDAVTA